MATTNPNNSDSEFFKSIGIDLNDNASTKIKDNGKEIKQDKNGSQMSVAASMFILTGTSAALGFFGTIALAKRREGGTLDKALVPRRGMTESGTKLALRALGWGTVFAVGGFALVSLSIYQMAQFRERAIKEGRFKGDKFLSKSE